MNALQRLKLVKELSAILGDLQTVGDGPGSSLKRLKLVKRLSEILAQLGAGQNTGGGAPSADPQVVFLQSVAKGEHDGDDLADLLTKIGEAIEGLDGLGKLEGVADQAANDALTRWVEVLYPKANPEG